MRNVVIGFLGTQLDLGRKRAWRPSVQLCTDPAFPVNRLELIHDAKGYHLACTVAADIGKVSPMTEVRLVRIDMDDPWDFQEVYGKLYDFAAEYGFDEDRESYHVHLTTGTHVGQICWFLLTESRHIPARLLQTGPPRGDAASSGSLDIIDLDLSRYNALQRRFEAAAREHSALLLGPVGTMSEALQKTIERMDTVIATSDAPILLTGEPGTGKSTLAARIHEAKLNRRRVKGRLVRIDCATLHGASGLAALLGQRRAAGPERGGLFREADGGVLFLDRIEELGQDQQAALLQVLEAGRYCPVGSDTEVTARFHLIAAASSDPGSLIRAGQMRADLLARLSQWHFRLPPLRERRADIRGHLMEGLSRSEMQLGRKVGFNSDALELYLRFASDPATPWSGNLRDLEASIHRMAVFAQRGRVTAEIVREEIAMLHSQWADAAMDCNAALLMQLLPDPSGLDEFDRAQLAAVVRACRESASLSEAGRRLFGVSRRSKASQNDADRLRKYLARFDLDWQTVVATKEKYIPTASIG